MFIDEFVAKPDCVASAPGRQARPTASEGETPTRNDKCLGQRARHAETSAACGRPREGVAMSTSCFIKGVLRKRTDGTRGTAVIRYYAGRSRAPRRLIGRVRDLSSVAGREQAARERGSVARRCLVLSAPHKQKKAPNITAPGVRGRRWSDHSPHAEDPPNQRYSSRRCVLRPRAPCSICTPRTA